MTVLRRSAGTTFEVIRTAADRGISKTAIWLMDANADGMLDVLTRPATSNSKIVTYLATGAGGFRSVESDLGYAWNAGGVAIVDANDDGRSDFVAGLRTTTIRTFISSGDGTFISPGPEQAMSATGPALYPGDFNADGRVDFISNSTANDFSGNIYYWDIQIVNKDGSYNAKRLPYAYGYGPLVGQPLLADFNGDSITDIAKMDGSTITVFLLDGEQVRKVVQTKTGIAGLVLRADWVGNLNGDEFADCSGWGGGVSTLVRLLADGKGGFKVVSQANPSPSTSNQANTWLVDLDGDSKLEPVSDGGSLTCFKLGSAGPIEDVVGSVINSHGGQTTFSYSYLTDPSCHTKGSGLSYPSVDVQMPMLVVSSMGARNGVDGDGFGGGTGEGRAVTRYGWSGAWLSLDGRGFQGFKAVEATDQASGIISRREFESSSPLLAGRPKRISQRLANPVPGGSSLISDSESVWNLATTVHPNGNKTYFASESNVSRVYEVNRPNPTALVKTVTRSGSFNAYGDLLGSTVTTSGAETYSEITLNTYSNSISPDKWLLGRLATSTVTHTGPNPAGNGSISLTRSSSFKYDPATGLLTQHVVEPSGGNLRKQTDFAHNAFGGIQSTTISCPGQPSRTVSTFYSKDGRFIEVTVNALGHAENRTFDPLLGNVLTQVGPNGLRGEIEWDQLGRKIREKRPGGTSIRYFYRRVTSATIGAPPRAVHYVRMQSSGGPPQTVYYDLLDRRSARSPTPTART